MTPGIALKILALAVLAVVGFVALRRLKAWILNAPEPRAGTRRLVMVVWAAFAPYETVQAAEDSLRRASGAVFGMEGVAKHEKWIRRHIKNFRNWEAQDSFEKWSHWMVASLRRITYGDAFEAAFKKVEAELQAQALEAMEQVNKVFFKETGYKLEAVKQSDGFLQFRCKQIWSDEEIERKKTDLNENTLDAVGRTLLEDQSEEAKHLLESLSVLHQGSMSKEVEDPRDVGSVWFACLEAVAQYPDSEFAQEFMVLTDAWSTSKRDIRLQWSDHPGCFERHLQRKYKNPLFPPEARIVTQEQIDTAREKDRLEAEEFREQIGTALKPLKDLTAENRAIPTTVLFNCRRRIDELFHRAAQLGGNLSQERGKLRKMQSIVTEMVASLPLKAELRQEWSEAVAMKTQFQNQFENNCFLAQALRSDSPITSGEFAAALLTEEPEVIRTVVELLDQRDERDGAAAEFQQWAVDLIAELRARGEMSATESEEKLQALGVHPPWTSGHP